MSKTKTLRYLAVTALLLSATTACANPLGGQVVGGNATIEGQGTPGVVIDQSSQSAIINWQSFNIGSGETTRFKQPDASSVVLNRVTGDRNPSSIFGTLTANGRVFLVNPDGFLFGPGSVINTGGFLATTHDIANDDFLAGRYIFGIPGNPSASIVNEGSITVSDTGIAALVAPGVRNDGIITARLGKIGLSSANAFTLDLYGDNLINFSLTDPIAAQVMDVKTGKPLTSLVENRGKLSADGGVVAMTATTARGMVDSVVNNSGVIEANSVGVHNGKIVLGAATAKTKLAGSPTQKVVVKGTLSVAGKGKGQTGGRVQITGEEISVAGAAIDASGNSGGGKVLIGGDTGGGTPSAAAVANPIAGLEVTTIPTATTVTIDGGTSIDVSAIAYGNGGKAIVLADGSTIFDGTIAASGGSSAGNGGFVETSGHEQLKFTGHVDTSAANGLTGTLLLDPKNVTIGSTGSWVVTVADLEAALATNNVVVDTSAPGTDAGNITVAESVTWANGNSLTLNADHDITVMPGVSIANTSSGNLTLRADKAGTGSGTVILASGAVDYSTSSGLVSIFYNPAVSYVSPTDYSPFVTTNGAVSNQLTAYMLVNDLAHLQNVQSNLAGNYALGKNIDATGTALAGYNGGAGFAPIGNGNNLSTSFHGIFDGQGFAIDGLTINTPASFAAPFGLLYGTIRNLTLTNESITGNGAAGLVANNVGTIDAVSVAGSVSGGLVGAGGLVGDNNGAITKSSSSTTVQSIRGAAGGLAIGNFGNITQSSATGSVNAQFDGAVGGLVGINYGGTISQSYSNASVSSTGTFNGPAMVGGLIGWNQNSPSLQDVYALGSVSGPGFTYTGGLIGYDTAANGSIARAYAAGSVSGDFFVGGLVGRNSAGNYTNVYWDTTATGQSFSTGSGSVVGTGVPTNQLKINLPAGFSGSVWGQSSAINGGYPFLVWQTATSTQLPPTVLIGVLPAPITLFYVATPVTTTYIYGTPLPVLQGTVVGIFLPGDSLATVTAGTLVFDTTATPASNIGLYPIIGSGLTTIGNYALAQAPANATAFKVNPAQLVITAKDQTKTVGTTFTFNGTEFKTQGLVNGDSVTSVTLASLGAPAPAPAAGSPYLIHASNAMGSGLGNYAIQYLPGMLNFTLSPDIPDSIGDPSPQSLLAAKTLPITFHLSESTSEILPGVIIPTIDASQAGRMLTYAKLCLEVNTEGVAQGPLPDGYSYLLAPDGSPLDWTTIMSMHGVLASDIQRYQDSGFFAQAFRNDKTGEIVVAFRESISYFSNPFTQRWHNDWVKTNFPELAGHTTDQYRAASLFAQAVGSTQNPSKLTLTGFSKGGGQASFAGAYADEVITFDAARNKDSDGGANKNQTNVIALGDGVGDPNSGSFGAGHLPEHYLSVLTTDVTPAYTIMAPPNVALPPDGYHVETHSLAGIIGGLEMTARIFAAKP